MLNNNNILIISGFDNTGGAGVLCDFKICNLLGIKPYSMVTSFAIQNASGGYGKFNVSSNILNKTFASIFSESKITFCKIGMVGSKTISNTLIKALVPNVKIILDTPMQTTSGFRLQTKSDILPILKKSFLITPNKEEFEELGGFDFFFSLKTNFLIKSFTKGEDVLYKYENKKYILKSFKLPFVDIKTNARGTGCSLASAITCFLYQGCNLEDSIKKAKLVIYKKYFKKNT